jgi:hypothetical protein
MGFLLPRHSVKKLIQPFESSGGGFPQTKKTQLDPPCLEHSFELSVEFKTPTQIEALSLEFFFFFFPLYVLRTAINIIRNKLIIDHTFNNDKYRSFRNKLKRE